MKQMPERRMFAPARDLFQTPEYWAIPEAPYGRKRIDLLLIPQHDIAWIAIELKIRNWKGALWQAIVNTQLVDRSFVAMWHTNIGCAERQRQLFEHYGVGLIAVRRDGASIVFDSHLASDSTLRRAGKLHYLSHGGKIGLSNASRHRALSLLSA
jgi:hypothetical protein